MSRGMSWLVRRLLLLVCLQTRVLILLVGFTEAVTAATETVHLRRGDNIGSSLYGELIERDASTNEPVDEFPSLPNVMEMAHLSEAVYKYKDYQGDDVCNIWNNETVFRTSGMRINGTVCHWYHHDKGLGTQVMIVSSTDKDYLAVVFAGTDDLMTSLLDADVRKVAFGTQQQQQQLDMNRNTSTSASTIPVSLVDCPACKVHEGFNSAVFGHGIFDEIYVRIETLRPQFSSLFTTGHSLGAANSILTAIGLALEFQTKHIPLKHPITSVNFGCPQVGNEEFRDYINQHFLNHSNATQNNPYLVVWRLVLGWDLVPRLPEFFDHIGHTVQIHHPECDGIQILPPCSSSKHMHPQQQQQETNKTKYAQAYYHHIGNSSLEYAGVPSGWSSTPYLWVPGALLSHAMTRYSTFLLEWYAENPQTWVHNFVKVHGRGGAVGQSKVQSML